MIKAIKKMRDNKRNRKRYETWGYLDFCRVYYQDLYKRNITLPKKIKHMKRELGENNPLFKAWYKGWSNARLDISVKTGETTYDFERTANANLHG